MKRDKKIIFSLIIVFFILTIFNVCYARDAKFDADLYEPSPLTRDDTEEAFDMAGIVLGTIRNISVVVSVIALMVIGLKYIFGSVEEKANYKETLLPYIIGCIVAVAGTTIVTFIYNYVR